MLSSSSRDTSFQNLCLQLSLYWAQQGCVILQPYDMPMGAGTFHPATVLWTLGPKSRRVAYVQPSRRPSDGRYGDNPNRLQKFHQFQVILKPAPENVRELLLESFVAIGMDIWNHDIRFVEDDWESPTLGAAGVGWEVWLDGMEVLQFTYFQQVGGIACDPISAELTYGMERLALSIQEKKSLFDLWWNPPDTSHSYTYGDLFLRDEREFSAWYLEHSSIESLSDDFEKSLRTCKDLIKDGLVVPAYEACIASSHAFNMLDARGALSITQRALCIQRVREAAHICCTAWVRQEMGDREMDDAR